MTETKQCRHCRHVKEVSDFFRSPRTDDGYSPLCRGCQLALQAAAQKPAEAHFEVPDG